MWEWIDLMFRFQISIPKCRFRNILEAPKDANAYNAPRTFTFCKIVTTFYHCRSAHRVLAKICLNKSKSLPKFGASPWVLTMTMRTATNVHLSKLGPEYTGWQPLRWTTSVVEPGCADGRWVTRFIDRKCGWTQSRRDLSRTQEYTGSVPEARNRHLGPINKNKRSVNRTRFVGRTR